MTSLSSVPVSSDQLLLPPLASRASGSCCSVSFVSERNHSLSCHGSQQQHKRKRAFLNRHKFTMCTKSNQQRVLTVSRTGQRNKEQGQNGLIFCGFYFGVFAVFFLNGWQFFASGHNFGWMCRADLVVMERRKRENWRYYCPPLVAIGNR